MAKPEFLGLEGLGLKVAADGYTVDEPVNAAGKPVALPRKSQTEAGSAKWDEFRLPEVSTPVLPGSQPNAMSMLYG